MQIQVNTVIRNEVKVSGVTFSYVNFTLSSIMLKAALFSASLKRDVIDINAYNIAVQQFGLHKRSAAPSELVEHQVPLL